MLAALSVAQQLTEAAPASNAETVGPGADCASPSADDTKTVATAAKDIERLVALVISRPDITSVSALSGMTIAIDDT